MKPVTMTRNWRGGLKHGHLVSLDLLAVTQAMEFMAHTAEVLEGEVDGLNNKEDAPHLFSALDKAKGSVELLSFVLNTAAEDGLDAKLKRCAQHVAFHVNESNPSAAVKRTRAIAARMAVRLANGEYNVEVDEVPTREQDLKSEVKHED